MPVKNNYTAVCQKVVRLLKQERERRGLSKYALEQSSGVSQQMIGYVERGLRNPSLETALRLADALELDLGKLVIEARKETSRSIRNKSTGI